MSVTYKKREKDSQRRPQALPLYKNPPLLCKIIQFYYLHLLAFRHQHPLTVSSFSNSIGLTIVVAEIQQVS